MTDAQRELRASLLDLLGFLASEEKQRVYAAEVSLGSYQGEFACLWFDTFYLDEPYYGNMFSESELASLRRFENAYSSALDALGFEDMPIQDLLSSPEWCDVIRAAQKALQEVGSAI